MRDDLVVSTDVLRRAAGELTGIAYRLGHGLAGVPGLTVPTPGWATAEALATVESAVHGWLGEVGGDLAELATAARTAADEYDDADQRAARRLSGAAR
ncbi:type VII secretion target [Solwaraspora sp. WMMD1047]|uniref:type VII secretion target n=1 Tax=Solwaraspora sp. WMMD1047 TaxID=3016102 RepID=UPI002417D13A|nr:type VII secretion target [Solwaraspora sp. WMMD1047]MDG4828493.1 type VII secretion target [Solwaraspora sp. WMMD1047]